MKELDRVPKEDYEYYIVEKTFIPNKKQTDMGRHNAGERIFVEKRHLKSEVFSKTFITFLENNCRKATQSEADDIYNSNFSNAIVSHIYEDKSYSIEHYYVPTKQLDFKSVITEQDWWERDKKKEQFFRNMGIDDGFFYELDDDGKFIYHENCKADSKILKYCREATPEETARFSKIVNEKRRIEREKHLEEERKKEQEKQERYNKNKSDSNYYPGSCGNYKQVLVDSNGKAEKEKLYDLYTIRQFYDELIASGKIDKEMLRNIIIYGGTVPYILTDTKEATRKFGDIDIFIPIENMNTFREILLYKSYFEMKFDSMSLTTKASLTSRNSMFKTPLYMGEDNDIESYIEYQRMVSKLREDKAIYQDYGFKGSLFGINISVFPIYQWDRDKNLDICAKSFRVGKEDGDSKFLLNTVVTHNTPISSFSKLVQILGGTIGIANLEYTIASKRSAIKNGYKLRQESDLRDLEFIEQNKKVLGINDDLVKHYEDNIPDYGIAKVYRIKRTFDVIEYTPEQYKNCVTKNHKPS